MVGFKKHNWMSYGYLRKGNIIEITIKDQFGGKMDFFRSNNPENTREISRLIRDKYGINLNPTIPEDKSINNLKKEEDKKEVKDKKPLDKDFEW